MLERLHFLVVYIGSAALVAFLAACLSSPTIATFTCHTSGANGSERCELSAATAQGVSDVATMSSASLVPDLQGQ